jgi:hypothetical protein
MLDYSWYLLNFWKSDIILTAEWDVVTDNPSSVAGYWGKKAKTVGIVDCLDNLDRDVQEGVRACIRNSSTTLRPEWTVDHPQLHLTLMQHYCRTRKEWIACLMTGIRHMSKHLSTQCGKKWVPQRCVMRSPFDFQKKKRTLSGHLSVLSGSPHLEFLRTEVKQLRSVMWMVILP